MSHVKPVQNRGYFHDYIERHRTQGALIIQPRMGFSAPAHMRAGLEAMRDCPGPRIGTITIDSYTRTGNSFAASRAVERGAKLNGYPISSYTQLQNETLIDGLLGPDFPIQVRHGSALPQHIISALLDAGLDATEGGPISYCLPYSRVPLRESIDAWASTCDMLAAAAEHGTRAHLESFGGNMLGQLCPPSMLLAITILEGIFSQRHGLSSISLSYAQGTHAAQDVSALIALKRLADHFLVGASVHIVFYTFMGYFPSTTRGARDLIEASARIAVHGGAERIIVKTSAEAIRIPSIEDNVHAMNWVRRAAANAGSSPPPPPTYVDEIFAEAHFLIAETLQLHESIEQAIQIAFDKGILDVPYCLHPNNRNEARAGIDEDGFVYWAQVGRIPFPSGMVWRRKTKAPDSEALLRMISFHQRAFDGTDAIERSPTPARLEQNPIEAPETTSRESPTKYKTAVVATTPSDSHTWNLVFIELFLAEQGYTVTNLGCCTPFETVVQKCRELQPALLAISTINGHGVIDGIELGRQIAGLPPHIRPIAVVGGKLGISGPCPPESVAALKAAGFHAVFDDDRALEDFRAFLAKLEARETTVEPTMREDAASEVLATGQVA